ncbi:MAG TPA: LacI family DNA-binding transcriptional regulator [Armatimonadaceae bacterium]|nr:LacI family DNA-binding transcriptional regulator [Armatimonadaceae bacterium]
MGSSIREVAREANVSLSTVSKVLNGTADAKFAAATRERVFAAARRVGYHPNAIARGLVRKRMDTVGLVMAYDQVSVTSDPYLGACLDGILRVNKERRQKTLIFTENSWEDALDSVPSYCDGHSDGLMVVIPRTNSAIVGALKERRTPFVLVGDSREDDEIVTVDADNEGGARDAVAYLVSLGHRRIAAFCGNADFASNSQRLAGYRRALREAGIAYREDFVFPGEYWADHGHRNLCALRERFSDRPEQRPTAVFCFNDGIAKGALDAAREMGLSVPDAISVIGFDDTPYAATLPPPLTTIRQDIAMVGEAAARVLLDRINGIVAPGHRELVPTSLVVRETTSPPPAPEAAANG